VPLGTDLRTLCATDSPPDRCTRLTSIGDRALAGLTLHRPRLAPDSSADVELAAGPSAMASFFRPRVAGPTSTAPVLALNWEPWHGQAITFCAAS
jgi:hypothetical protein